MLFGRILTDGRLNARVKCDLTDNLTLKANAQVLMQDIDVILRVKFGTSNILINFSCENFQLTNEPHMSHGMVNFDYKVRSCYYYNIFCSSDYPFMKVEGL